MKVRHLAASMALSGALSFVLSACGGGGSPAGPSGGGGGTPPPVVTTTIVLTAGGVDNKRIQVAVGAKVTFVNNDVVAHEMSSNPHPSHTECPSLNIGSLAAGERRETAALTAARTCGYHDHNNPTNGSFQGSILIQ